MITGKINLFREAVIELVLQSLAGQEEQVEGIVDTGFNGSLSLPLSLITRLGYQFRRRGRALLADGRESIFDIYEGSLIWNGARRRIAIDSVETDPLVGMRLLESYELRIQVIDNGQVAIEQLA